MDRLAAKPPTSLGEFWGTWQGQDWSPSLEAACRIVVLEDQLEEAQRLNAEYRRAAEETADRADHGSG